MGKQTMIGIDREKYNRLNEKKKVVEEITGQKFNWGTFLLVLAGLITVDQLTRKNNRSTADLHEPHKKSKRKGR